MAKFGKKYADSVKLIEKSRLYDPAEAMALVCQTSKAKFDETIEVHVRLGVDSRHADQQVRGAVVLPNGTGKKVRTLVFAKGDHAKAATEAGSAAASCTRACRPTRAKRTGSLQTRPRSGRSRRPRAPSQTGCSPRGHMTPTPRVTACATMAASGIPPSTTTCGSRACTVGKRRSNLWQRKHLKYLLLSVMVAKTLAQLETV